MTPPDVTSDPWPFQCEHRGAIIYVPVRHGHDTGPEVTRHCVTCYNTSRYGQLRSRIQAVLDDFGGDDR